MVDVYIVVYSLLGILICLPALLVALNLLMPQITVRIETRLGQTPGKSFFLGVPVRPFSSSGSPSPPTFPE